MKIVLIVGALLSFLIGLVYIWGYNLPSKLEIQKTNLLPYSIEKVWGLTRDIEGQMNWRSDIKSIQLLDSSKNSEIWKEVPLQGPEMTFQSTKVEEPNYWRMDMMETQGFTAHWIEESIPFWRVIEPGSLLAKKLSFGEEFIVEMRKREEILS